MAKIEDIIYNTTRELLNLNDKLNIAIIFIFCWKLDSKIFAELLYTERQKDFIDHLIGTYECYGIVIDINFADKNINSAFQKTLKKVKEAFDKDGFFKAVFEKDAYALSVIDIANKIFDKKAFKKHTKKVYEHLKLEL